MVERKLSGLSRRAHAMPEFVARAIEETGVTADYLARPLYQQNDYIGWITRAKREGTQQKRLEQMIEELRRGGVYMNMAHPPSRKR